MSRDLSRELQEGISLWQGPAVFSSHRDQIRSESPNHLETPTKPPSGSAWSPISVASSSASPSPSSSSSSQHQPSQTLLRPPAVPHFSSPLPRTAFTSPRSVDRRTTSTSPSSVFQPTQNTQTEKEKQIHPFFTRPRTVPPPNRPRLVAHYSSTSASAGEGTSSQSASQSQSQSQSQQSKSTFASRSRSGNSWEAEMRRLADQVEQLDVASRPYKRQPLVVPPRLPVKSSSSSANSNLPNKGKGKASEYSLPQKQLPLFHYRDHPSPPQVVYTASAAEANDLVSCLKGNVVGFDLEWPPAGKYKVVQPDGSVKEKRVGMKWDDERKKWEYGQGRTALVQLCDEKMVLLIHLGENMELPSKVVEIIQDPAVYKLGVQVKGDGLKLLRDFPDLFGGSSTNASSNSTAFATQEPGTLHSGPSGLLELSYLARAVDPIGTGPGSTLIKLSTLCAAYLGKELEKPLDVRKGNWFSELRVREKDYAANDVYSSLRIFRQLQKLAQERGVLLDLDKFCSNLRTSDADISTAAACNNGKGAGIGARYTPDGVYVGAKKYTALPGYKAPSPSQIGALNAFVDGISMDDIAELRGVKRSTVENYILLSIQALGLNILSPVLRKRLWLDIPDNGWSWKRFAQIRTSLIEELGAQALKDPTSALGAAQGAELHSESKHLVYSTSGSESESESESEEEEEEVEEIEEVEEVEEVEEIE